ncbi:MAG: IS4 family transposase [Syntrophobacterales bacterium CG_4_8_14_3_um_filter_49_14]|nr:MAG: IS4 family transposase [Syntrophobacterales bacterium CG_4_8_14_3_um_filter_49_14]
MPYEFNRFVYKYKGNHRIRKFPCYDQFLCLAFAQLTYRESLRDIETCLNSHHEKLYHIGFRGQVSRSTLADADEVRDYRIYQDLAYHLISIARNLCKNEELAVDIDYALYAFDSTTIDLCLSLFPWAHFRKTKAAIKMHTFLDLRGSIPTFICLTPGNVHDVKILDIIPLEKDSVIAMDRGYIDFARLYAVNLFPAFFVIRAKNNLRFTRLNSQKVDKTLGLRADQRIVLKGKKSRDAYPDVLRRVSYVDLDTNKRFVFLTNIFTVPAKTVADIYKQRWQVELFFRWIKQHLRIKTFYGTSPNAVKIQIWTAVSIYLLVAIMKKRLQLPGSLHTILQILEVNIFEKRPIIQIVKDAHKQEPEPVACNQLNLFNS